jgi:hypothetical protein
MSAASSGEQLAIDKPENVSDRAVSFLLKIAETF